MTLDMQHGKQFLDPYSGQRGNFSAVSIALKMNDHFVMQREAPFMWF